MVVDADKLQQKDKYMNRQQRPLTLGELIRVVAGYSTNDHEVGLTVADLLRRRVVVRAQPSAEPFGPAQAQAIVSHFCSHQNQGA